MRWPKSANSRGSISDAGVSCPALFLLSLGFSGSVGFSRSSAFSGAAACACLIACSASISAALAPRGSAQMKSPTRTKSAPAAANSLASSSRGGKADAGRFEQFFPPLQTLGNRLHRRPLTPCVRFAEQHVIGACFARGHRIVPGRETADAGDAVGFQRGQRVLHRCDAGQMRAIGAGASDQFDMTIEQQRRAAVLDRRRQRLDTRDHGALVGFAQPHQYCCDVGACEQAGKAGDKLRWIVQLRA